MTQSALAKAAGTVVPYISQLESGARSNPGTRLLDGLCDALGVTDRKALFVEPSLAELIAEMEHARKREAS